MSAADKQRADQFVAWVRYSVWLHNHGHHSMSFVEYRRMHHA